MSYIYPRTTYKPVSGPEDFEFLIGLTPNEALDVLFMGTFDKNFFVVVGEQNGHAKPYSSEFDPYRIIVSTIKGTSILDQEDDIIFRIDGLY